jgi:hypothetical protein
MTRWWALGFALAACKPAHRAHVTEVTTTVIEKGEEPKYVLRYALPAGSTSAYTTALDMSVAYGDQKTTLPHVELDQGVSVDRVDPKTGAMDVTVVLADLRHEASPELAGYDAMKGMVLHGTLLPSGETRGMEIDPTSVPAQVRDQLSEPAQILDQVLVVLPDVPVGAGAKWSVERTAHEGTIDIHLDTTFELLEVTETTATLHAVSETTADPQSLSINGATVTLDSLSGRGDVTETFDATRLVDTVHGTIDASLRMSGPGGVLAMDEHMEIECK